MSDRAYEDAAVQLLRRLAGRLADDTIDLLWSYLGAGEYEMFEDMLFGQLEEERVGLAADEIELFRGLLDDPRDARLTEIPPAGELPRYTFSSRPDNDSAAANADEVAAQWAAGQSKPVRVVRAWREPANSAARAKPGWVYVVMVPPEMPVKRARAELGSTFLVRKVGSWPVEPVAAGERPPEYQRSALQAGKQIWPTR
jgi:hypothetical protein